MQPFSGCFGEAVTEGLHNNGTVIITFVTEFLRDQFDTITRCNREET